MTIQPHSRSSRKGPPGPADSRHTRHETTPTPSGGAGSPLNQPLEPRGWQIPAIGAITDLIGSGGRAQVHAACGTGKTQVALAAALRSCPQDAVVVVACPSLGLLAQTLRAWASTSPGAVLAACSDDTVTDAAARAAELPYTVTTDPTQIAKWLGDHSRGLRLIGTTHASALVVGQALTAADVRADLLIIDEAHHAAGDPGKHLARVHDDRGLPAERRLYLTATPQYFITGEHRLSMHDEAMFGPVAYRYSFAEGIADGWIDDYRLLVVAVTRTEALTLLKSAIAASGDAGLSLHQAVIAAALGRAAAEYDLRRIIAYHPRRALSRQFAATLEPTLALLDTHRPDLPLFVAHVEGADSAARRDFLLRRLAEPPGGGWAVLSNARCLSEGIDIPAIDTVLFTAPKSSATDTVQAIGRALRRGPAGPSTATVLVPVLVADDPAAADSSAQDAGWATVWNVVRGLRSHDDLFGAMLDSARSRLATGGVVEIPEQIQFRLPDSYDRDAYLDHIRPLLITATTHDWWEGYGHAAAHHGAHGDLLVPVTHINASGFALGKWLAGQRTRYNKNLVHPQRVKLLENLGMCWRVRDLRWEEGFAHARTFHDQNGHVRIPVEYRSTHDGFPAGSWLHSQRRKHRLGRLDPDRAARLTELGVEWWPYEANWERGLAECAAFLAEHGHLRIPQKHETADGFRLGAFITAQRTLREAGRLSDQQIADLEQLGISWKPRHDRAVHMLEHAADYYREHGNLDVRGNHLAADDCPLGQWIKWWRRKLPGQALTVEILTTEINRAGDAAANTRRILWARGLAAAGQFHTIHGHLRPSSDERVDGITLFTWLYRQRRAYAQGQLSQEHVAALDALGIDWTLRAVRHRPGSLAVPDPAATQHN
ncbi:Helicase associated domain protein [Longispora sp. NPDC051575]|uniref:DEAD/DEAH box helicase n=1 Tax=Longispora sp. NPDC051575 TaxID=3154943 RepID=UPI0034294220